MRSLFAMASLALLAFAVLPPPAIASDSVSVGELRIVDPWARASAGSAANGAIFLQIRNTGSEADWLTGVSSPAAMMSHIHETAMEGGVMKMRPIHALEIPAGGEVTLKPHGLHIMLMKLKAPLKQGEQVMLTLQFEKAGEVEIAVPIAGPGAMEAPHMH